MGIWVLLLLGNIDIICSTYEKSQKDKASAVGKTFVLGGWVSRPILVISMKLKSGFIKTKI